MQRMLYRTVSAAMNASFWVIRSAAHLKAWFDDGYATLEEEFNPTTAASVASAHRYAIDAVNQVLSSKVH